MTHSPTNAEIKLMTEGERLVYLITKMDATGTAVENLVACNSLEHEQIHKSIIDTNNIIFDKIDTKVPNKLFYFVLVCFIGLVMAFSNAFFDIGKQVSDNNVRIINIERKLYHTYLSPIEEKEIDKTN